MIAVRTGGTVKVLGMTAYPESLLSYLNYKFTVVGLKLASFVVYNGITIYL